MFLQQGERGYPPLGIEIVANPLTMPMTAVLNGMRMRPQPSEANMNISQPKTTDDTKNRIENLSEVIHAIVRHDWLQPDGNTQRVEVDNPRILDSHNRPKYLRVSIPRKGLTFKVINTIEEFDLKVADVWQHDVDKENDRIMLKVEQ